MTTSPQGTVKTKSGIIVQVPTTTGTGHPNTNTTKTSSLFKKIDVASATQLLLDAQKKAGYTGKLSDADIQGFISDFNKQSAEQAKTVAATVQARLKPGATPQDVANATNDVMMTVYPDYFNPRNFANDFIWAKWTNPASSKFFGGAALDALNQVRQFAKGWGNTAVSEAEIQAYAKSIVMKTQTPADVNASIRAKGAPQYPQFADQINRVLAMNPNATMYDVAQPYINQMAKTLEMDPSSITLDNQLLDSALRPDGTAGKLPAMSLADFSRKLMDTPQWEQTTTANTFARDGAVGLAKAMGRGL